MTGSMVTAANNEHARAGPFPVPVSRPMIDTVDSCPRAADSVRSDWQRCPSALHPARRSPKLLYTNGYVPQLTIIQSA